MEKRSYFSMMFGEINPDDGGKTFSIDANDFSYVPQTQEERERLREAYNRAHEIRKFEIELYWKRATYFWAFELVALTGFGALFFKFLAPNSSQYLHVQYALILVSLGGALITYLWELVLRGSKSWQKNWEKHIDILEHYFSGNLYKCMFLTNKNPFSSSTASIYIATTFLLFWIICFLFSSIMLLINYGIQFQDIISYHIIFLIAVVLFINELKLKLLGSPHKIAFSDFSMTVRYPNLSEQRKDAEQTTSVPAATRPDGATGDCSRR